MTTTILDYYNYAALATASYVRLGNKVNPGDQSVSGSIFAETARDQDRIPLVLGTALFNPADATAPHWNILSYYGGDIPANQDPIAARDASGFGATLFMNSATGEKVLALRGTEPSEDGFVDLLSADLGQIGIFGGKHWGQAWLIA